MAEKIEAKVLETEEQSLQEKEQELQKDTGVTLEDGVYKVDLSKVDAPIAEPSTEDGNTEAEQPQETEKEEIEQPIVEEITDETNNTNETGVDGSIEATDATPKQEEILQEEKTQEPVDLPENIQDLVKFMEETGGSLEDYVRLSADYANADQKTLLREYYKQTKPHLNDDEVSFLMESDFSWDEEVDEPKDIKKKQIALKEEVAKAKNFLTGLKDQYYKAVSYTHLTLPTKRIV